MLQCETRKRRPFSRGICANVTMHSRVCAMSRNSTFRSQIFGPIYNPTGPTTTRLAKLRLSGAFDPKSSSACLSPRRKRRHWGAMSAASFVRRNQTNRPLQRGIIAAAFAARLKDRARLFWRKFVPHSNRAKTRKSGLKL